MKPLLFCLTVLCCGLVAGCDSINTGDPVVKVEETDQAMNEAIESARKSFPQFLKHWKTMSSDGVGVKVGLPTADGDVEHIWFKPITITDTEVTGICSNDPYGIPNLSFGDKRTFQRSDVTDWMIVVGNKCYGGYTVRVLSEMEPENSPGLTFVDFEDTN
jgi:uncharacterized protein YegJ (DUF2314 family)